MQQQSNSRIPQHFYELPQCPICLEELSLNIASLKCGHCFHYDCIKKALRNNSKCPYCQSFSKLIDIRELYYSVTRLENSQAEILKLKRLLISTILSEKQLEQENNQLLQEIFDLQQTTKSYQSVMEEDQKQIKKFKAMKHRYCTQIQQLKKQLSVHKKEEDLSSVVTSKSLRKIFNVRTEGTQLRGGRSKQLSLESQMSKCIGLRREVESQMSKCIGLRREVESHCQNRNINISKKERETEYLRSVQSKLNQLKVQFKSLTPFNSFI